MDAALLKQINQARKTRQPVAVITDISSGAKRLVKADTVDSDPLSAEVSTAFRSGKSGLIESDGGEIFLQVHVPSFRLVVIGAVHISQALVPMAQACGFDVKVIDPRTAFATDDRFPNVDIVADWPPEVLADNPLDAFTALVAVTHDPKIDDFPISEALRANCFYVGALGSRKTHAKRRERLLEAGVDETAFERIHAPIGLNIGAASPAEIAVAVMAQILAVQRTGTTL